MTFKHVTSSANPLIKAMRRVASGDVRKFVLIEGPKLIREALETGIRLRHIVIGEGFTVDFEDLLAELGDRDTDTVVVPDRLLASSLDVKSSQGIAALASLSLLSLTELRPGANALIAVADSIQDPGNLGAIIRSAIAFGAEALITLPGCAHPLSPKSIRGSAGASLRMPMAKGDVTAMADWLRKHDIAAVGLDSRGSTELVSYDFTKPCAIIVGNEGSGLSPAVLGKVDALVRIDVGGGVESLNTAVAASVAFFEASRQRAEAL